MMMAGSFHPPLAASQSPLNSVSLAVTSSVSFVPACGQNSLTPLLRLSPPRGARRGPLCENYVHSLCSAFPHATRFAGLARGPRSVLPKRLRPQARVVGQPPHKRRHLGRRQTGRTRKGYAASVSGKAANGCAVDGPREKIASAGRSAQARTFMPPARDGWTFLVITSIKRDAPGESSSPGRARIPLRSLSAGAGLAFC